MSKIICDVCGTAYPDTAQQCPICGSARLAGQAADADETGGANTARDVSRHYDRGGHFSKSNVKKRNRTDRKRVLAAVPPEAKNPASGKAKKNPSNKGLIITALVLLLAVIAMTVFIFLRFFWQAGNPGTPASSLPTEPSGPSAGLETSDPAVIPCTSLSVKVPQVQLDAQGRAWLLEVKALPADTTQTVTYASGDEHVATVTQQGRVTAVGEGSTVITVTCGDQTATCKIICVFPTEPETTAPTEPEETQTQETQSGSTSFSLDRSDITLFTSGETFRFSVDGVSNTQITWSSRNTAVATISNGIVTAVGPGTTTIDAEYDGRKASCIIRCNFEDDAGSQETTEATQTPTEGEETTPTEEAGESGNYTVSHTDVTIQVGESFTLTVLDGSGRTAEVSWSAGDGSVCSVSGDRITGLASGTTTVSGSAGGQSFSCIVRVR